MCVLCCLSFHERAFLLFVRSHYVCMRILVVCACVRSHLCVCVFLLFVCAFSLFVRVRFCLCVCAFLLLLRIFAIVRVVEFLIVHLPTSGVCWAESRLLGSVYC